VLTPHPGELSRLTGLAIGEIEAGRLELARRNASAWGQVLVSKGAPTVIAAPDGRAFLVPVVTPALATAGTGDVLAGTICGLLAQGAAPLDAAAAAAYVHAHAGLELERAIGLSGALAGDLLELLPRVMQRLREERASPPLHQSWRGGDPGGRESGLGEDR
jgi:NAD(P)H-hydrate epimerase